MEYSICWRVREGLIPVPIRVLMEDIVGIATNQLHLK